MCHSRSGADVVVFSGLLQTWLVSLATAAYLSVPSRLWRTLAAELNLRIRPLKYCTPKEISGSPSNRCLNRCSFGCALSPFILDHFSNAGSIPPVTPFALSPCDEVIQIPAAKSGYPRAPGQAVFRDLHSRRARTIQCSLTRCEFFIYGC
jgi:hypothetical protein